MTQIHLSQTNPDIVAIVDPEDYEWLSQWVWSAQESRSRLRPYRVERGKEGKQTKVYMSRVILAAKPGDYVDHINGDPLDNRRSNLRLCTNQENLMNRGPNKNNKSGFKGVSWSWAVCRWRATIMVDRKQVYLGSFDTPEEAAYAYDRKALELFGDFAVTNQEMGLIEPMAEVA